MDKRQGFTLIESLIVLIILGLASTFAIATLKDGYLNLQNETVLNTLRQEILLAKNLAITQQQKMSYCAINKEWQKGRTILDSAGNKLRAFKALPSGYRLILNNSLHRNDCIIFTMLGMTLEQRGSFYLENNSERIRLIIDVAGLTRQ